MRQTREATALGAVILRRMAKLGMLKQVDLARASGISESTISRLIYEDKVPERETLGQVELALGLDQGTLDKLLRNAGAQTVDLPKPKWEHPVLAEANRMLAPGSPLSKAEKEEMARFIERILVPYRSAMRRKRAGVIARVDPRARGETTRSR